MKKKLKLEDVKVESYETMTPDQLTELLGTVQANSSGNTGAFPLDPTCFECHTYGHCSPSEGPMDTCQGTCATRCGTCYC